MVDIRSGYTPVAIQAARQLLIDLAFLLRDRRDQVVLVGGMACGLLFSQETDAHDGTIDIDLALDPARLAADAEETLEDLLMMDLYQQDIPRSYRWIRTVYLEDAAIPVKLDLLACEYDHNGRVSARIRDIQGIQASVLHGMDLAFLDPKLVFIEGVLSNGQRYATQVQVCNAASLLAMKGIAVTDRQTGADKDARDIDYLLRRYPGGPQTLARVFSSLPYSENDLVAEGLRGITTAFKTLDSLGPRSVATEARFPDPELRAIEQQRAFQRVQHLLRELGNV